MSEAEHPYPEPSGQSASQADNVPGLVGFVITMVALIGLTPCTWFMLALGTVGMIVSVVGLWQEPRGLAIAGTVVGAIESVLLIGAVIFVVLFAGGMAAEFITGFAHGIEVRVEASEIQHAARQYQQRHGALPADLSVLEGLSQDARTDPWGNRYHIRIESGGVTIISGGPDARFGTLDDIRVQPSGDASRGTPPAHDAPSQP